MLNIAIVALIFRYSTFLFAIIHRLNQNTTALFHELILFLLKLVEIQLLNDERVL